MDTLLVPLLVRVCGKPYPTFLQRITEQNRKRELTSDIVSKSSDITPSISSVAFGRLDFDLGEDTEFPIQKSQSEQIVGQTDNS
jgi:hypothetical protein